MSVTSRDCVMPHQFSTVARLVGAAAVSLAMAGCPSFGPRALKVDQVDYARALGDAKKREILALIVGLRYADSPAFLTVTQVISAYTFTASATPMTESVPPGPTASVTGIGGLSNAAMLGGPSGDGSPGFFELLTVLRRLQLAGEASIEFKQGPNGGEARPVLVIHAAKSISGPAYAAVRYRSSRFWIDDTDFDSKYALTVVQDLMALAEETDVSHAPVVTVPAG